MGYQGLKRLLSSPYPLAGHGLGSPKRSLWGQSRHSLDPASQEPTEEEERVSEANTDFLGRTM